MVTTTNNKVIESLAPVSNDADRLLNRPFIVRLTVEGQADMLCHAWSNESVAEKAAAPKNSKAKKSDDVESYVYRNDSGEICVPSSYLHRGVVEAGRFHQDPRSPRKSAFDLLKAAIVVTPPLSPLRVAGHPVKEWDYLSRLRVTVQRAAITRERPAFRPGWRVDFEVIVNLPEYVSEMFLRRLIDDAGRFCGFGDHRPTYGRYVVVEWSRM